MSYVNFNLLTIKQSKNPFIYRDKEFGEYVTRILGRVVTFISSLGVPHDKISVLFEPVVTKKSEILNSPKGASYADRDVINDLIADIISQNYAILGVNSTNVSKLPDEIIEALKKKPNWRLIFSLSSYVNFYKLAQDASPINPYYAIPENVEKEYQFHEDILSKSDSDLSIYIGDIILSGDIDLANKVIASIKSDSEERLRKILKRLAYHYPNLLGVSFDRYLTALLELSMKNFKKTQSVEDLDDVNKYQKAKDFWTLLEKEYEL